MLCGIIWIVASPPSIFHIPHRSESSDGAPDLVALGSVLSACEAVSAWQHALALLSGGKVAQKGPALVRRWGKIGMKLRALANMGIKS